MNVDLDKSLEHFARQADESVLQPLVFTSEMEQKVKRQIDQRQRKPSRFRAASLVALVCASLLILLVASERLHLFDRYNARNGQTSAGSWKPSPLVNETYNGRVFSYYGEKPVRIITSELYEDQGQKVMWLLNGTLPQKVKIVASRETGERVELGKWQVGGPNFDADGHFPSGITLPDAGIWRLDVVTDDSVLGTVYIEVKPGVAPYNQSFLEEKILDYLRTSPDFDWLGKNRMISIDLFGVQSPDASNKTGYAWVVIQSFRRDGETLVEENGMSAPMVFKISYTGNDYRVVAGHMPKDGSEYRTSLQELFPKKYLNYLDQHNQEMVEKLLEKNRNQAEKLVK